VHKGSTQTNKRSKIGFKSKGAKEPRVPWSGAQDCPVCHRTVSGAPGPYTSKLATFGFLRPRSSIIHRTVQCATGLSGAPAEQRLPAQRSTATDTCERYSARTVRAEVRAVVRGAPDSEQCLSGATRRQSSNGRLCLNPNGWVTWLAHRTVRCAHRQQPNPTVVWWFRAINTPQPLPL
jgi:hypothetical protein